VGFIAQGPRAGPRSFSPEELREGLGPCDIPRPHARLNLHRLRPILPGVAKAPETPKPIIWTIYKIAAKQTWVGTVEANDEAAAIEKAAAEFRIPATKLHAVRQR